MSSKPFVYVSMIVLLGISAGACSSEQPKTNQANPTTPAAAPVATATTEAPTSASPARAKNSFTAADIAKLKWLEGSYRVPGDDKTLFNRYHFDGTTMTIESFEDEAMTKRANAAIYKLKDGVFGSPEGKDQFTATEITEDHVQFVSDPTHGFRMAKQADGTVTATLEWTNPDGKPDKKTFTLERIKK